MAVEAGFRCSENGIPVELSPRSIWRLCPRYANCCRRSLWSSVVIIEWVWHCGIVEPEPPVRNQRRRCENAISVPVCRPSSKNRFSALGPREAIGRRRMPHGCEVPRRIVCRLGIEHMVRVFDEDYRTWVTPRYIRLRRNSRAVREPGREFGRLQIILPERKLRLRTVSLLSRGNDD